MSTHIEQIREKYQQRIAQGESCDGVIEGLHADGISIIDSMKVVRILYGVNLRDAKRLVTRHPVWAEVVRHHEPLHDALEKYFEEEACRVGAERDDLNENA